MTTPQQQGENQGLIDKYLGTVSIRVGLEPETLVYLAIALSLSGWMVIGGSVLIKNVFSIIKE